MPSENEVEPGLFVPQTIFAAGGDTVLMGVLKKGELRINSHTSFKDKDYTLTGIQVFNSHVKSIKAEDKGAQGIGITLSNNSVTKSQEMTNKELLFK